jgi:hypothetical protein
MKKTIRFGATGVALAAALGMSSVAQAQDATADATAEVLSALTLVWDDVPLDFGGILVDTVAATGGSLTLAPDGTPSCGAGIICSGTTSVAGFDVTGSGGRVVTVTVPTTTVNLNHATLATSIPLTAITASGTTVTTDASGDANFTVGGTIAVSATQAAGVYSNTFQVSVDYQ